MIMYYYTEGVGRKGESVKRYEELIKQYVRNP